MTLQHNEEELAEAWYMPDGDRFTLVVIVPGRGVEKGLTVRTILEAAGIPEGEVESWRFGIDAAAGDLDQPLPVPPPDEDNLTVYVHLKPPAPPGDVPLEKWHALDSVWSGVLGLESAIEAARLSLDALRGELENAFRRSLATEDKLHALQADVAQWNKAKTRIHHAVPKLREFVHRATWALAAAERKRLGELVRTHVEPRVPLANVDQLREAFEHLQKERQLLLAQGNAVGQECRGILAGFQTALGTLQRNAADRARQKRSAGREKGKHF